MVAARGRARRRLVRRGALGSGRGRDPAGDRPERDRARAAVRTRTTGRAARAVVAHAQGNRARRRSVRAARRRARDRRGTRPPRGVRALPQRRHRRRPAERRLVRRLRDRGDGTRQAGRHVPPRRGRRAHRRGVRRRGADRERDEGDARRRPPPARRVAGRAPPRRCREPRLRRARPRRGRRRRPPGRSLRWSCDEAGPRAEAARSPHRGLRPRRDGLARPRGDPAAALHALPPDERVRQGRDDHRADGGALDPAPARDRSAFFRFYFDAPEAWHKLTVVRTSFWFTMGMATLGLAIGTIFAPQIARLLGLGSQQREPRHRRFRRALGADELSAAHRALPRRGALDGVSRSRASRTSS